MSITPNEIRRETNRRLRRLTLHVGEEIRRIRQDANLSIAEVSRATGIDHAYISRIEAGKARPSSQVLIAIGVALGADLSLRFFPGFGPRLHDRFQAPMLEGLLAALHPRWRVELEVPVRQPIRGVIDVVLHDAISQVTVAGELQSEVRRLEQQIRWSREKAEALVRQDVDAANNSRPSASQLLVLRSTVRTREIARQFEGTLRAAFPARTVDVIDALTWADVAWPGSGIVWVNLEGSEARLMRRPPPSVRLGR